MPLNIRGSWAFEPKLESRGGDDAENNKKNLLSAADDNVWSKLTNIFTIGDSDSQTPSQGKKESKQEGIIKISIDDDNISRKTTKDEKDEKTQAKPEDKTEPEKKRILPKNVSFDDKTIWTKFTNIFSSGDRNSPLAHEAKYKRDGETRINMNDEPARRNSSKTKIEKKVTHRSIHTHKTRIVLMHTQKKVKVDLLDKVELLDTKNGHPVFQYGLLDSKNERHTTFKICWS
ncbi:hypothetical protein SK128_011015 [Halocaridina rubra]|uniref:Uncharacterized protein n=1 Tax=Halocaridina rubra TaxID=373956 RepID=A0AAN8XPC2_HALRR